MKDYNVTIAAKFSRFGCLNIVMSDRGFHFLNEIIVDFLEEFHMYHQKRTLYHPQANGTIEAFNKILEITLTKICNARQNDWDLCIPAVLWAYRTMYKKLPG